MGTKNIIVRSEREMDIPTSLECSREGSKRKAQKREREREKENERKKDILT